MATSSSSGPNTGDALIVGVDFGTTFSGVAWCYSGDPDRIRTIKNWPGSSQNLEKVPTILSYNNRRDLTKYKWGFEVKSDSPNAKPLAWFKLLLGQELDSSLMSNTANGRRNFGSVSGLGDSGIEQLQSTLNNIPAGKKPVDLVTDYLRQLHTHTTATIEKAYPPSFTDQLGKTTPIKYCLTVPAVWSDKAKALTIQAAKAAGMNEGKSEIRLITEPEAAAVHCLKTFQDTENCLKVGDIYVIADCGGGTADLISYQITSTYPRLKVKECAAGTGGLCGSTYLNRSFEAHLKARLGTELYEIMSQQAHWAASDHFDKFLKPTFCPPTEYEDADEEDDDDEQYFCPVPGVPNDRNRRIHGNFMEITLQEMKDIFEATFSKITKLVQEQVRSSEERTGSPVTGILLVGGFGSSEYLRKHLSEKIIGKNGKVKILQPVDAWTAIVRGAVLDNLAVHQSGNQNTTDGPGMVQSRIARFSYGVKVSECFIPGFHPSKNKYFCTRTGMYKCKNRMLWLVKQGEEIGNRQAIDHTLRSIADIDVNDEDLRYEKRIYCCPEPNPPMDWEPFDTRIYTLCKYEANFASVSKDQYFERQTSPFNGEVFWSIKFDMIMRIGAQLEFSQEIGGVAVGKATVEYDHECPSY